MLDISSVSFELLLLYFGFGLILLSLGAHWFVEGAISLSVRLNISKILIGSIIMSLATTSPELLVSLVSVYQGQDQIAIGNIFGSYIANIGLVLGISGMIRPITVSYVIWHRQIPFLVGGLVLLISLSLGSYIATWGAVLLLLGFLIWAGWLIKHAGREDVAINLPRPESVLMTIGWFIAGVLLMQAGAVVLVSAAEGLAISMGVSPYVIGVSIVAIGTSLPELAAGIYSAIKGEYELILGNIIGANILLITFVLPMVILSSSAPMVLSGAWGDYWFMTISSILLWIFSTCFDRSWKINRYEACSLIMIFIAYQLFSYR